MRPARIEQLLDDGKYHLICTTGACKQYQGMSRELTGPWASANYRRVSGRVTTIIPEHKKSDARRESRSSPPWSNIDDALFRRQAISAMALDVDDLSQGNMAVGKAGPVPNFCKSPTIRVMLTSSPLSDLSQGTNQTFRRWVWPCNGFRRCCCIFCRWMRKSHWPTNGSSSGLKSGVASSWPAVVPKDEAIPKSVFNHAVSCGTRE